MTIRIHHVDGMLHQADLYDMQAVCFPNDKPHYVGEGDWFMAIEDYDFPVGFSCLTAGSIDKKFAGYLALGGVLPEARGLGLQRRMIKAREKLAIEQGRNRLYSYTYSNPASTMNLIRSGFHIYRSPSDWGHQRRYPAVTTLRKFL